MAGNLLTSLLFLVKFYLMHCDTPGIIYTPVINTTRGAIRGEVVSFGGQTVHRYRGIPYAAPPVGELRFAPPRPPDRWAAPRDAVRYGSRCVTHPRADLFVSDRKQPPMSEDCLFLNLVTPSSADVSEKRAVMVYIHGGTLYYGSASDVAPEALTIAGDVIHVTINYRLNIFGFIATEDNSAPGNVGMLDQVLALKWVKENVARFGGDPDRVTIFGISAGGWSVSAHMVSPLSKGLFSRAIIQSGSLYGVAMESKGEKIKQAKAVANDKLGCSTNSEREMLKCLRSVASEKIMTAYDQYFGDAVFYVIMTYGDEFMPRPITEMYDEHQFDVSVPVIAGIVSEEGSTLVFSFLNKIDVEQLLQHGMDKGDARMQREALMDVVSILYSTVHDIEPQRQELVYRAVLNAYINDTDDKIKNLGGLLDINADVIFTIPTLGMLNRIEEAGGTAYLYYFDHTADIHAVDAADELAFGVPHHYDMFYMFGYGCVSDVPRSVKDKFSKDDRSLCLEMVKLWTEFAMTGRFSDLNQWPQYHISNQSYLKFTSAPAIKAGLRSEHYDLWTHVIPHIMGLNSASECVYYNSLTIFSLFLILLFLLVGDLRV